MVDETSHPDRRDSHHSSHRYQPNRLPSHSAGQVLSNFWQLLQHEAVFGLQLLLAFSVSFSAVQLTRSWISHTGMFAAKPTAYSARVFWPENTLAILPSQASQIGQAGQTAPAVRPKQAKAPAQTGQSAPKLAAAPEKSALKPFQTASLDMAKASAKAPDLIHPALAGGAAKAPAVKAEPKPSEPIRVAVSRTPANHQTRLNLNPNRSFTWSAPRAKQQPSFHRPAQLAKAKAQQSYRVAARQEIQRTAARQRHEAVMQPLRKMLHDDYKVAQLKSYDEYMGWVRKTLKTYKD